MCKLWKELPPVNLAAVICDSWSGMTGKLVPGSIIVCSMGSSTARGVKITGVCRSPPLPDGVGRRRLAALSGLPDSAARRQNFFGSYCITQSSSLSIEGCIPMLRSLSLPMLSPISFYWWINSSPASHSKDDRPTYPFVSLSINPPQYDYPPKQQCRWLPVKGRCSNHMLESVVKVWSCLAKYKPVNHEIWWIIFVHILWIHITLFFFSNF